MRKECKRLRDEIEIQLDGEGVLSDEGKRHLNGCEDCQRFLSETEEMTTLLTALPLHRFTSSMKAAVIERLVESGVIVRRRVSILDRVLSLGTVGVGVSLTILVLFSLVLNFSGLYSSIFTSIPDVVNLLSKTISILDRFTPIFNALGDVIYSIVENSLLNNGTVFILSGVLFTFILLFNRRFALSNILN